MNSVRVVCGIGIWSLLLTCGGGCTLDAQTRPEANFDRTLSVAGPVDLDIRSGAGTILIHTGQGNDVRVIGQIRAGRWAVDPDVSERIARIVSAPPLEQNGNIVRVGHTDHDGLFRDITISYDVTVPFDTHVRSRSGSGDQTIGNVRGPIDVGAGSGELRIGRIAGDVEASTGSGSIELERSDGGFVAHAGSGSIKAASVGGSVVARTGSGRIEVKQTSEADVNVTTGSGDIAITGARSGMRARAGSGDIEIEGRPAQHWALQSGSGTITMRLAPDSSFTLNAQTGSGGIEMGPPITLLGGAISRRKVQGTVRGGGATVDVSTGSGSIRIR